MRWQVYCAVVLSMCLNGKAQAQADACRGALSALNRVKEKVTPDLSPATEFGKEELSVMLSSLERGSKTCSDSPPEIWQYRDAVGRRLGTPDGLKSAMIARNTIARNKFPPAAFDPFSQPPVAPAAPVGQLSPGHAPVAAVAQPVHNKWALVIGINTFEDPAVPKLHYASKDAKDFAQYLRDPKGGRFPESNVTVLTDEAAKLQYIREGIGALRVKAQPDDLVVIYISSHGSPRSIDPNGVSYIIAADTHTDTPERLYASSLQMIDLVQQINREIRARRVVLLLDTCYSGDAQEKDVEEASGSKAITRVWSTEPPAQAPSSQGYSEALDNLHFGYGRAVITASRANQQSWESETYRNGYFTHFLLAALAGENNAPLDHVFRSLKDQVSTSVKTEKKADQTPTSQFSDQGQDIVLSVTGGPGA